MMFGNLSGKMPAIFLPERHEPRTVTTKAGFITSTENCLDEAVTLIIKFYDDLTPTDIA